MPRRNRLRSPGEEEEYKRQKRKRHSEYQRKRRAALKEVARINGKTSRTTFEPDREDYLKKIRARNAAYQRKHRANAKNKPKPVDEETMQLRRARNAECQRKRRAMKKINENSSTSSSLEEEIFIEKIDVNGSNRTSLVDFSSCEEEQPSSGSTDKPLFKNQDLLTKSLLGRLTAMKETTNAEETATLRNEIIFVKGEPSVLIYYRDNATLGEVDPLEIVQVKTEPKTEPVDFNEIAEDELIIKQECLMYDYDVTNDKMS